MAFLAAFYKVFDDDEEAVDKNVTEGGRTNNIGDKASDNEEFHEADSEETNDTAGRPCIAGDVTISKDKGLGKDADDKDLFEVNSNSNNNVRNNNDEIKARLLHSMMKCLANATSRVNEGGSDIIDRIRIHLSNRIKESISTNDVDPDNLVDEERGTLTPETFGLKSIGFKAY